jgi:hypothetical protein
MSERLSDAVIALHTVIGATIDDDHVKLMALEIQERRACDVKMSRIQKAYSKLSRIGKIVYHGILGLIAGKRA